MARINTNISSVVAQSNLNKVYRDLDVRLKRLSTGLRINAGVDDPAGLIISERIRSDIRGVEQGIANGARASSVIATTEAALSEVNELLNSIRALIVEGANTGATSDEERAANQLQIDSAIDAITRISNTATFGGLQLLDGGLDYTLSGVSSSAISKARVHGASLIGLNSLDVNIEVLNSAQVGALFLRGDYVSPVAGNGTILSATTLEVRGPIGVEVIEVPASAALGSLVDAVNAIRSLTGVEAERLNPADDASGIVFKSTGYGADSFVSVERLGGPASDNYFQTYKLTEGTPFPGYPPMDWATLFTNSELTTANRDAGRDVSALVNGTLADGDGLDLAINSRTLTLALTLHEDLGTRVSQTSSFTVTGGGALFQLGPNVVGQQQFNMGIQSMSASNLGGSLNNGALEFLSSLKSGQSNSLRDRILDGNDFSPVNSIIDQAIDEVSILRGRLGAIERNVIQPNSRNLEAAFENLTASVSQIRDADFAAETSLLTRAQILASSGTSVLSLANQQAQQVLQLLG